MLSDCYGNAKICISITNNLILQIVPNCTHKDKAGKVLIKIILIKKILEVD